MTPLARWFNRPRKNSTPTRLALSEFMNISSSQQQKFTFPPNNRHESTQSRTPMLITSSFYNQEYPFDTYESSADEAVSRPTTPDLQPQQYQTIYNQQTSFVQEQPTQLIDIPQAPYVTTPQHNSMPSLTHYHVQQDQYSMPQTTHYINLPRPAQQYIYQPSTNREEITFQSHEQQPRKSRYRSTHGRVPTPYTNERYPDEDNQETNGKRFSAEDIAGFEKLKNDFKKLEKKHKRNEKRVQELEYLLYSQSLESKKLCQYPCNYYYPYYYPSLEEKERLHRDYYAVRKH